MHVSGHTFIINNMSHTVITHRLSSASSITTYHGLNATVKRCRGLLLRNALLQAAELRG